MRSRYLWLFLTSIIIFSGCGIFNFSGSGGEKEISPELIKKYVFYLASDSLKGRDTPSPELDTASVFIANQFKKWGLEPVDGSYFQKVKFGYISLGDNNHLTMKKDGKVRKFNIKEDFTPFEMTANKEVNAQIVFAGYGITAPEFSYDDYKNIDVKNKIVFILKHEPGEKDTSSVFDGVKSTEYSSLQNKIDNAVKHGASGVLIATDPLNHLSLMPVGFPWPSLSKIIPEDALPLTLLSKTSNQVPVVQVGEDVIKLLFTSVDSLKKVQTEIDKKTQPVSFVLADTISLKTSTNIKEVSANNVVGYIEGSDSVLKNELLIVGAHYDHVGYIKDHKPGEDYIYNGADDNASGAGTMMAVSAAFGTMKNKPKRSVLFIAFCGEEKGLLGSEDYTENPLFPLDKTVAMLNLDMVGRNDPDSLYIIGGPRSPDLKEINIEENKKVGFILSYNMERFLGQSDQASFLKKNIPILFYHTGEEQQYHKVSDEAYLINYEKASSVAHLVFLTALHIANDSSHYRVTSKKISLF